MRKLMKLITITAIAALLFCVVISCASADEKIYTSPVFKLPKEQLKDWSETLPEEADEPETPGETEDLPGEDGKTEDLPGEDGKTEETDVPGEQPEEDDGAEPARPERAVLIFSTQKSVETEGEFIYLTSELIGFDDVKVTYQWQVNRNDGLGWVDIEGATRDRYMFVASVETIRYGWRLIVDVVE